MRDILLFVVVEVAQDGLIHKNNPVSRAGNVFPSSQGESGLIMKLMMLTIVCNFFIIRKCRCSFVQIDDIACIVLNEERIPFWRFSPWNHWNRLAFVEIVLPVAEIYHEIEAMPP